MVCVTPPRDSAHVTTRGSRQTARNPCFRVQTNVQDTEFVKRLQEHVIVMTLGVVLTAQCPTSFAHTTAVVSNTECAITTLAGVTASLVTRVWTAAQ